MQAQSFGGEAPAFAAELCRALNDWIRDEWLAEEPRLRGSICPPHEHPELAVQEIERLAGDPRYVQVLLPGTAEQGLGDRKYRPILRAAAEAGLPVALHTGGNEMHRGAGWPSYYLEMHVWNGNTMAMQAHVAHLQRRVRGAPGPADRLGRVRDRVGGGHVVGARRRRRRRSARTSRPACAARRREQLREHFWFSTQPIEEPEDPEHLAFAFDALGMADRIMFSTDYPHWDFDAPGQALPRSLSKEVKQQILAGNACRLYGLSR